MTINAKRLLKLADYLETVPRKAFDLSSWQTRAITKPEGERPGECGFAGCAVGWAAHAKLFRGFTITDDGPRRAQIVYHDTEGWSALDELFGFDAIDHDLGEGQAEGLFSEDSYPETKRTPKQVAKRIRKFVRDNQASAP